MTLALIPIIGSNIKAQLFLVKSVATQALQIDCDLGHLDN